MARHTGKSRGLGSDLSTTDQLAHRAAAAFAKGRSPSSSKALEDYFDRFPLEIFAALDGAVANMPPAGQQQALAYGYLFLLEGLLLHLRYRIDRGYAEASHLVAEFQAAVAGRVREGSLALPMLGLIVGVLQQAGIAAAPALVEASVELGDQRTSSAVEIDLDVVTKDLVAACGGDPFALVASGAEACHAMPQEARIAMVVGFASADNPVARAAAVLFLLDPSPEVRIASVGALAQVSAALSPVDVRRLIAFRDWRPEPERAAIDALIRRAREAGVDPAPWRAERVEEILATAVDGSTSQGLLVVSPSGRKKRLSSILVKNGIADAFVGEEMSLGQTRSVVQRAVVEGQMAPVSRAYLDGVVCDQLAILVAGGRVPPVGLLDVAESVGATGWGPVKLEFDVVVGGLLAAVPAATLAPPSVRAILARSGDLVDLIGVADSWFEDDAEVSRLSAGCRGASRDKRAEYMLQVCISKRRGKWADVLLATAVWLREADPANRRCWRDLAVVAKAVAEGRNLTEIGLMVRIALQTVDCLDANRRS